MIVTCLDLESVLIPEIWISVADATGVEDFRKTTRDVPDYNVLMQMRLDLASQVGLRLGDIQAIVEGLEPLPGALPFLSWLRTVSQVSVVSDTFYEFVQPVIQTLGWPFLYCHHIQTDADENLTGYSLRQHDSKKEVLSMLRQSGFTTIAIGDSHNDVAMLYEADLGILFNSPKDMSERYQDFTKASTFDQLKTRIQSFISNP